MSITFEKVTDLYTKYIVNGYLKQQQSLLPFQENSYYNIPSLVIHLILSFYHKYIPEYFTDHQGCITVNDAKDIATYIGQEVSDTFSTLYGTFTISKYNYCNKFIWEYKIIKPKDGLTMGIGLDSSNKLHANSAFDDAGYNKSVFYSFESDTFGDTCKQFQINHQHIKKLRGKQKE